MGRFKLKGQNILVTPTGEISVGDINLELGTTGARSMGQADGRELAGVPTGAISMDNYRGKSTGHSPNFEINVAPVYNGSHIHPFYGYGNGTRNTGGETGSGGGSIVYNSTQYDISNFFGGTESSIAVTFDTNDYSEIPLNCIMVYYGDNLENRVPLCGGVTWSDITENPVVCPIEGYTSYSNAAVTLASYLESKNGSTAQFYISEPILWSNNMATTALFDRKMANDEEIGFNTLLGGNRYGTIISENIIPIYDFHLSINSNTFTITFPISHIYSMGVFCSNVCTADIYIDGTLILNVNDTIINPKVCAFNNVTEFGNIDPSLTDLLAQKQLNGESILVEVRNVVIT